MLTVRLQAVADMVTPKNVIADIGTDHGYVPIYLVKNGISPYAYAMDVNVGPVMRAKANICEEGLSDKIQVIQSDGLGKLQPGMADTVVIAGMGGELIIQILKQSEVNKLTKELVLSPQRRTDLVRKFLHDIEWNIVQEKMVIDMGKFYTVIKAVPGKEIEPYNEVENIYGRHLLDEKSDVLKEYLEKEYKKFSKIRKIMENNNSRNIEDIERKLEYNRKAVKMYDKC